jgi:NAD(P)H-flavin reductase
MSPHAVRLYFTYTNPTIGTAIRLSERSLIEWHTFATIAKPDEKEFSVIVSNAGDWTSRQIKTAPTKLWVRGVPACGVLRIAPLFRSIVLVATGSGIGPCLPVIYARQLPARIFWSTPHPDQNFGPEVISAVKEADPNDVIHNTKTMGRPDMVAITYRLLRESGAEAICIISNKKLTQMVVYAMESRGIPAFGAIFDS